MADNTNNTNDNLNNSLDESATKAEKLLNPLKSVVDAMENMVGAGNTLNKNFGLARSRIEEMKLAFVNTAAGVERVGGSLSDVVKTISEIASSSHRNVIENKETVAELYASYKVLGIGAAELVKHFKDVGYETSQIGPNLGESVKYIQSVGLNASSVMKDVSGKMEYMNRFQFEGGVTGLAKMAAQASMLRIDMGVTAKFADDMLSPEKAIETASAFQRLGVLAGDLVDPFALMNESINDPTGLQNSLARVGQEFTYFDEKTKSFKINPQGVLTLREMEKEAGLASGTLSKSALAAADLDRRLSEVSGAGLKFENEEDKQYLANIAKMGKGGKYEVTLEDGTTKELQNLNQKEFDKLIDQQRKAPKDMEEIAKSQLSATNRIDANMRAFLDKAYLGTAAAPDVRTNLEGLRNIASTFSDYAEKLMPETEDVSKGVQGAIDSVKDVLKVAMTDGFSSVNFEASFANLTKEITDRGSGMTDKAYEAIQKLFKDTASSIPGGTKIEQMFKDLVEKKVGPTTSAIKKLEPTKTTQEPLLSRDRVMGIGTAQKNYADTLTKTQQVNSQVDFGGTITIDVKTPSGVSQQEFKTYFESEEFKKKIYEYYNQKAKELGQKK